MTTFEEAMAQAQQELAKTGGWKAVEERAAQAISYQQEQQCSQHSKKSD